MLRLRELLALAGLICCFVVVARTYPHLPALIPSPFNHGGDAHGLGARNQLWLLVGLAAWCYGLMSLLNLLPVSAVHSSPPLTETQQIEVRRQALAMLGWLKAAIMLDCVLLLELNIHKAQGRPIHLGLALDLLMFLPVLAIIGIGLARLLRVMRPNPARRAGDGSVAADRSG